MNNRNQIRNEFKRRRADYSAQDCASRSLRICEHIRQDRLFTSKHRFALYYPVGNEVNLLPLMDMLWAFKKTTFLPVLANFPKGHLWWLPYSVNTPLYNNKFGIPEPVHSRRDRLLRLRSLDVIFMPLVAYDQHGNRMGMGGGFYDRSLAKCYRSETIWHRPLKIGVAYSWQQAEHIPVEKWDIPLDAVATEDSLTWF